MRKLLLIVIAIALLLVPSTSAAAAELQWHLRNCNCSGPPDYQFGYGTRGQDIPVTGDWDFDALRTDTIGVFNSGSWWLRHSNSPGPPNTIYYFGQAGDHPLPGGWGAWIKDVPGVARDQGGTFHWYVAGATQTLTFTWGIGSDTPRVVGSEHAVAVRGIGSMLRWYPQNVGPLFPGAVVDFGSPGDHPVIGDWNGDGLETPGVYRVSQGMWYLKNTWYGSSPDVVFQYGSPGNYPVVGDWNGDGYDTIGVVD